MENEWLNEWMNVRKYLHKRRWAPRKRWKRKRKAAWWTTYSNRKRLYWRSNVDTPKIITEIIICDFWHQLFFNLIRNNDPSMRNHIGIWHYYIGQCHLQLDEPFFIVLKKEDVHSTNHCPAEDNGRRGVNPNSNNLADDKTLIFFLTIAQFAKNTEKQNGSFLHFIITQIAKLYIAYFSISYIAKSKGKQKENEVFQYFSKK